MENDYLTLKKEAEAEFTEKRSRFIGYCKPVATEQEAIDFINQIRQKHRDARHNVYAYIVNDNGNLSQRYSDDGEPQGTGGMPVLDVLAKKGITNACIVVTRYFGGILLGAPGLVRAYGKAASKAVEEAGILEVIKCHEIVVTMPYNLYDKVNNYFQKRELAAKDSQFGEDVTIKFDVPVALCEGIEKDVINLTGAVANIIINKI